MCMFWSDRYHHSSSSADTLGIFKYIDQASFYGMGWMGGIIGRLIFKIEILKFGVFYITLLVYIFEMGSGNGLNGVTVDRHGLILWENGATGSRKVFRCLLDLQEAIF